MADLTIRAARVHTGSTVVSDGVLRVADGRVLEVRPGGVADVVLDDCTIVPGFVDAHVHGGGGAAFADDPDAALAVHRAHGTTTTVASLVSQSLDVLEAQVRALAPRVRAGDLAGIHLEGPWLSPAHKGAHPASQLRAPTASDIERLLDAADGTVVMVTLAPELDGGLDAVRLLADRGIVVAIGHTGADLAGTRAAVAAGATGATHLFNAMPPLHHRRPGPILAFLEDDRVWLELVCDGAHVDPTLIAYVLRQHPGRTVLITDAMAAAGCADGAYTLGDLPVEVVHGVAHIAGSETIAGSTLTQDAALAVAVSAGVPWEDAVAALTANPARYLGLDAVGVLERGSWADAVALDGDWNVRAVLRRGEWVVAP